MHDASLKKDGSVGVVNTQHLELSNPLELDCGRSLYPVRIAYETYGQLSQKRDNVILICHALSADAHAAGWSEQVDGISAVDGFGADDREMHKKGGLGWWDGMIGPGKSFDTDRFFVICTNLIGGCRGSTGPSTIDPTTGQPFGSQFPVITVPDMVRAQHAFLNELDIDSLICVSGASLGGMQALEWAAAFPEQVRSIIAIATTARLNTQGMAWNAIARNAIMADPAWQNGDYYGTGREPEAGMGVARMVGHVTYLSAHSIASKFGHLLQDREKYSYTLDQADFQVENYLKHQAKIFAQRFDANTYLYISRALTYFDLARTHGNGNLEKALAKFHARTLLICFKSDWLYPPENSQKIAKALRTNDQEVEFHNINAPYGHDSFLLEEQLQEPIIKDFLNRTYGGSRHV